MLVDILFDIALGEQKIASFWLGELSARPLLGFVCAGVVVESFGFADRLLHDNGFALEDCSELFGRQQQKCVPMQPLRWPEVELTVAC